MTLTQLFNLTKKNGATVTCYCPDMDILYQGYSMKSLMTEFIPMVIHLDFIQRGQTDGYFLIVDKWGNAYSYNLRGHWRYLIRYRGNLLPAFTDLRGNKSHFD